MLPTEPGTEVNYHGSLADYHGPATVVGPCPCPWNCPERDSDRWRLTHTMTGDPLRCARRSSFTVQED